MIAFVEDEVVVRELGEHSVRGTEGNPASGGVDLDPLVGGLLGARVEDQSADKARRQPGSLMEFHGLPL